MFFLFLLLVQTPQVDYQYVVMLKNGKLVQSLTKPEFKDRQCLFTSELGEVSALPASIVDMAATEQKNSELEQKRQLEEEAAKAEQEAMQAEAEKSEPITIESIDDENPLPITDASRDAITLDPSAIDPTADGNNPDLPPPDIVNHNNSGNDPFFIKQERIQRTGNGYTITCTVQVDAPSGAQRLSVSAVVYFEGGGSEKMSSPVSPTSIKQGETGTVTFQVNNLSDITRTEFSLSGMTGS